MVGEYAAWFGKAEGAPLEGALRLLLAGLAYPGAWKHAAHAFRNMCVRCGGRLQEGQVGTGREVERIGSRAPGLPRLFLCLLGEGAAGGPCEAACGQREGY